MRESSIHWDQVYESFKSTSSFLISRYWKHAAIAVVTFPFLLEISLQLASISLWSIFAIPREGAALRNPVIVCIGDYFTTGDFDQGITSPYPDRLRELFARQGKTDWTVLSYTAKYLDSEDAVTAASALVVKHRPSALYLMIGINDFLGAPANDRVPETPLPEPPKLQWLRTKMLVQEWIRSRSSLELMRTIAIPPVFLLEETSEAGQAHQVERLQNQVMKLLDDPFSPGEFPNGQWFNGKKQLNFAGKEELIESGIKGTYSINKNLLLVAQQGKQSSFIWESDGQTLLLNGSKAYDTSVYRRTMAEQVSESFSQAEQQRRTGWIALDRDDIYSAKTNFQQAMGTDPSDPMTHAGLAIVSAELGQHSQSKKEILWLQSKFQADPTLFTARALSIAYPLQYSVHDSLKMLVSLVEKYPQDPWLWNSVAAVSNTMHLAEMAQKSVNRALEIVPGDLPELRATMLKARASILASSNPSASFLDLVQAYLQDDDANSFVASLQENSKEYDSLDLDKVLNQARCSLEVRKRLFHLAYLSLERKLTVARFAFENRLKEIAAICRENNTILVLLDYPAPPQPQIELGIRKIAQQTGFASLNLGNYFENLLKDPAMRKKLVREGHLTEEASQVIAEVVAADIQFRFPH